MSVTLVGHMWNRTHTYSHTGTLSAGDATDTSGAASLSGTLSTPLGEIDHFLESSWSLSEGVLTIELRITREMGIYRTLRFTNRVRFPANTPAGAAWSADEDAEEGICDSRFEDIESYLSEDTESHPAVFPDVPSTGTIAAHEADSRGDIVPMSY